MGHPAHAPVHSPEADEVERRTLARIGPDPTVLARVTAIRAQLVERFEEEARALRSPLVRALVAGSAARGTFLVDRFDLDVFLLFPPELSRERLEEEGLGLGARVLHDPERRYAEHPYLRGTFEGLSVEAVPGYAITDPSHPMTAVDRTPFHHEYLMERLTPELVAQVLLTKQFLRSIGVYGSEAKTSGCSGYLVELLVLRFGSLRSLLSAARSWRLPVRLTSSAEAAPRVPDDVAMILDDPVDSNRNVASALSRRNLAILILAASAYLSQPSNRYFSVPSPRALPLGEARSLVARRKTHVGVLRLPRPPVVDDILYPQLRKAERSLAEEADRIGFSVLGTSSAAGARTSVILLETTETELSAVRVQEGPPPGVDRTGSFLEKWTEPPSSVLQGPYVRADGKLAVETLRPARRLEELLGAAIRRLPLGRDLKKGVTDATRLMPLEEIDESDELPGALAELLGKRLPWRSPGPSVGKDVGK